MSTRHSFEKARIREASKINGTNDSIRKAEHRLELLKARKKQKLKEIKASVIQRGLFNLSSDMVREALRSELFAKINKPQRKTLEDYIKNAEEFAVLGMKLQHFYSYEVDLVRQVKEFVAQDDYCRNNLIK